MKTFRHAIVVGASSGIGTELVRLLAGQGARVAAVARRADRLRALAEDLGDAVLPVEHDVTRYDEVPGLLQEITRQLGGLDLIVYAAGVMPPVGPREYSFEKDRRMLEVNVLGAMAWLNQAAIRFENTGAGSIVGVGSVAGDRGRGGQPGYNTSKAALATYLEALRNRLVMQGVDVVTIKPGPTATEMTAHLHARMMDPARVARVILSKAGRSGEHYVSFTHRVACAIIRSIPGPIFRRLGI